MIIFDFRILLLLLIIPVVELYGRSTVEKIGDVGQYAVPGAMLGYSICKRDGEGICELTSSTLVTMSAVYALKYSLQTKRPEHGKFSFPSGHTASAFAGAAYLHHRYGFKYAIPAYLASSFVGYSRVYARRHYTCDVLAGAAIAVASSYIFTTPYAKCVRVTPVLEEDFCGFSLDASL